MSGTPWSRERLLQTSSGYWLSCLLHAAVQLDLFSHIPTEGSHARQIAQATGADPEALERLLEALVAAGLLTENTRVFSHTPASRDFLTPGSSDYVGDMLRHHHFLMESWQQLAEVVRTGTPNRTPSSLADEEARDAFQRGMANNSALLAPQITAILPLQNHRKMLDLGGGPGTYAIRFCQANPQMRGDIFDLPTSKHLAEYNIHNAGLSDRLRFVGGNFLEDLFPDVYDFIWLSHILHGEGQDDAQTLMSKSAQALIPGGLLVIQEFVLQSEGCGPLFPALFSLNMLLGTDQGRSYREIELTDMMANAGLTDIQRLTLEGTPSTLLLGHRPKR